MLGGLALFGVVALLLGAKTKEPTQARGRASAPAARVIDATGPKLRFLPVQTAAPAPARAAPRPVPGKRVAKPMARVALPPAGPRTPAQAARPAGPPSKVVNQQKAQGNRLAAQARALTKPVPAAAQVRNVAPAGTNLPLAKKTAADVAQHIRKTGTKYKRDVLARFQKAAGLKDDGLYGPVAASALSYFGAAAPKPLFKGQDLKYVPPTVGV